MKTNSLHFSTWLAILSFSIGTLLLGCYFLNTSKEVLLVPGLCYLIFSFVINLIVLFYLLMQLVVDIENQEKNFIRILILISNIPITLLYMYIIFN